MKQTKKTDDFKRVYDTLGQVEIRNKFKDFFFFSKEFLIDYWIYILLFICIIVLTMLVCYNLKNVAQRGIKDFVLLIWHGTGG